MLQVNSNGSATTKKPFLNKRTIPYLLMAPAFIYYAIFWLIPVATSLVEVFTSIDGSFTLTENFLLMFNSDLFGRSVFNTATFAAVSVVIQYVFALAIAIVINLKFKFSNAVMFISMIPMAVTPTAVAILWKTGLVKDGWINSILMSLGIIEDPIVYMSAENISALFMIILIDTWTVTPSVMIILSAGLQGIQKELGEAGYIFGANKWQRFTDITLPILRPSIITSIILRLIAAIQVWAIAVMVLGYDTVPFLVERIAFFKEVIPGVETSDKLAYTYSFMTTVVVFITTMIYYKVTKKGNYLEVKE